METLDFLLDRPMSLFLVLALGGQLGSALNASQALSTRSGARPIGADAMTPSARARARARLCRPTLLSAKLLPKPISPPTSSRSSAPPISPRALLNRAEANVFAALDKAVMARNQAWQVMAQVSLGEFLASPDTDAFFAINSKRVDFALMDERCCVRHALEYQGNGHHLRPSVAARGAVKKEALRKAGIGYHEVVAGHTRPGELRALVEKLVPAGISQPRQGAVG